MKPGKLRYSVRDLLWLTLLAAVLTSWWIDNRRLSDLLEESRSEEITTYGTTIQLPEFSYNPQAADS